VPRPTRACALDSWPYHFAESKSAALAVSTFDAHPCAVRLRVGGLSRLSAVGTTVGTVVASMTTGGGEWDDHHEQGRNDNGDD
jgi:hypothetical protein